MKKNCKICGAEFQGEHFMDRCRECYWHLKGFSWECRSRQRHTPEDLSLLKHGSPFGSGMWDNGQILAEIKLVGGFEQYSYEAWDEMWHVKTLYGKEPLAASSACLLCAIKMIISQMSKSEKTKLNIIT